MNLSELLKLWRVEKGSSQLAKMPPDFYREARKLSEGENPYEAKKAKDLYNDVVHMRQHKMLMACLRQLRGGAKPENLLGSEKSAYDSIYRELESMHLKGEETVQPEEVEEPESAQETLPEAAEPAREEKEEPEQVREEQGIIQEKEPEEVKKDESGKSPKAPEKAQESEAGAEKEKKKPEKKAKKEVFKGKAENKALKRVRFLRPMPAFVGPDMQTLGPFDEDQEAELDEEVAEILLKNDAIELI